MSETKSAVGDTHDTVPSVSPLPPSGPLAGEDTRPDIRPVITAGEDLPDLRARFVGRSAQLSKLKEIFFRCRDRQTLAFVTLVGEPGVGKTRLAQEFARSVRAAIPDARVLNGESAPNAAPHHAAIRLLEQRVGISASEHPEDARAKIETVVNELLPTEQRVETSHLLAHLMMIPYRQSSVVEPLLRVPGKLRLRTYLAVRRFIESDARRGPVILSFDGMERCSSATENLLHYLADGLRSSAVVILASSRPKVFQQHPNWGQGDFEHHRLDIGDLGREEAKQLFCELTRCPTPPESFRELVCGALGGRPRSIYELARLSLEAGLLRPQAPHWKFDEAGIKHFRLPKSHEQTLGARLDSLSEEQRNVLSAAAAVGETFWLDCVLAQLRMQSAGNDADGPRLDQISATAWTRGRLAEALGQLGQRGLIAQQRQSTIAGEREYRFCYELTREIAYGRSEVGQRPRRHRVIAQWLESHPTSRSEARQEQIAGHLELAADFPAAAARYRRAAEASRTRYANEDAVRLYKKALHCADGSDRVSRMHLWHDLGATYHLGGKLEPALDAFERVLRLSWALASRPKAALAFNRIASVWRTRSKLDLSREYVQRGLDMFVQGNDRAGISQSLSDLARILSMNGRYAEALDRAATALEMRRQLGDPIAVADSLCCIGDIELRRGLLDEAESCAQEALAIGKDCSGRLICIEAQLGLGATALGRGNMQRARNQWGEALAEAERIGALQAQAKCLAFLGYAALRLGNLDDARQRLERASSLASEIGDQWTYVEAICAIALVEQLDGNRELATATAQQGLDLARKTNCPDLEGCARLTLGEIHATTLFDASLTLCEEQPAEEHYSEAVAIFRRIGNQAQLARALRRLGQCCVERGEARKARGHLAEALKLSERLGMPEAEGLRKIIAHL